MSTEEKMIKAVELKGAKENLDRFAFTIPDYLQNEWAYADDKKTNRYYIGDRFPPFRVCLIIFNGKYILRYIIPTDDDAPTKFSKTTNIECMKYFLEQFSKYADDCGINYEIIYEEKEGE